MHKKLKIIFVLFFIILNSAFAQPPYTLQQCIDRALQYNIQIKQSSLNNDLSKVQVDQNSAAFLPSINGNASQNYFFGRHIDPYTNIYTTSQVRSNSFSLSGTISLFEGFQLQNSLKESKLNYLASQNELKKIQNDISLNVVGSFLQVLYTEELMENAEQKMNATVFQRDKLRRMNEIGAASRETYLELESQVTADEVTYVEAQSQHDQAILTLTQLLELDTIKNFSIVRPEVGSPIVDSTLFNVDYVYTSALNTQPEIKSSMYKVSSAEKNLAVARGGVYPKLYLSGSANTSYSNSTKDIAFYPLPPTTAITGYTSSGDTVFTVIPNNGTTLSDRPFKDQFNDNLGKSVALTLQVPLFNGWLVHSNISRAKINLQQSKLNNDLTKKNLFKSVQQAVADANAARKKFEAGQRSVDAMTESYNFNNRRLELGMISTYDFLISKNNLANSQTTLLQSKYDYIFKIKILDFYLGKPLTF